ncbi:hypothetical protein BS47DRAFT_783751 [Hydnum rufescens UP504]|uniref:Uncharacterized protein n=1 Tax=Hydnum rufescens UP504 TaxID=1448309 RepID=A0A9P6DYC7_9AGAM|nr:hypothetical protein BS47DRAFT_783751 [Hydnum rufescens UP504]
MLPRVSRQALFAKLAHFKRKNEDLEADLDRTRAAYEALESKLTDVSAKLERAELNLGSAKQDLAEKIEEIKKWHRLDKREDQELEELRRIKADLETRVKELEDRVQDDAIKIKRGKADRKSCFLPKKRLPDSRSAAHHLSRELLNLPCCHIQSELENARETIDHFQEAAKV